MEQIQKDFTKGLNQSIALIKSPLEWENIRAEQTTLKQFWLSYVLPFAAIPVIGAFIGTLRAGITYALAAAIVAYIASLLSIAITSFVVQKLAPKFNGNPSLVEATKLVAYSMAPVFLGGILSVLVIIGLGIIASLIQFLLGVYAIYLFYKGVGPMTSIPEDKRVIFIIVTVVTCFVLNLILSAIIGMMIFGVLLTGAAAGGAVGINYRG